MSITLSLNKNLYHTTPYDASLDNIGNPFKGLPSLEEDLSYGSLDGVGNPFAGRPSLEYDREMRSLEGVGNPFAGLPSLEENQRSFKMHIIEDLSESISRNKESPTSHPVEKITRIALEFMSCRDLPKLLRY